jgi:energy-coupling factor transporter ATP-binding protein EcfA2
MAMRTNESNQPHQGTPMNQMTPNSQHAHNFQPSGTHRERAGRNDGRNRHSDNGARRNSLSRVAPERNQAYFDRIPHVKAKYRGTKILRHRGNAYIQALPGLPSDVELTRALARLPQFKAADRDLPAPERLLLLNQLNDLFVPTARHTRLMRSMLKLMILGYEKRNPETASHRTNVQSAYEAMQDGAFAALSSAPLKAQLSMGLAGASGCGKTYTMRHVMDLLPSAIYHPQTNKWQLPFLFIEMPYDGESVHTLASSIFEELDRLLPNENYGETYLVRSKLNAATRLSLALKVAAEHGVGMIIVDEQQNQRHIGNSSKRPNRNKNAAANAPRYETPLIKLLITASNNFHIPLCMTGTLESQEIVGARFTRSRRMTGNGSALWLPLQPTFDMRDGHMGEFEQTMAVLWKYQWVTKPSAITPKMHELFWRLTQGLPDMMVKLFSATQEAAIVSGKEQLTLDLFQATYDSQFWAAHLGLEALRTGDKTLTQAVPDLHDNVRSPIFRAEVLESLCAFRERNNMPMSKSERKALLYAREMREAVEKKLSKDELEAMHRDGTATDMKRAVDHQMDDDDRAMAATLARRGLLQGINSAGPAARA